MAHLKQIVQQVFESRLPVRQEVLKDFDEGFCDGDPRVGSWLREYQQQLQTDPVDLLLANFLHEGILPRLVGSELLNVLDGSVELFYDSYLAELAFMFWDVKTEEGEHCEASLSIFEELEPSECFLFLLVIARVCRAKPLVGRYKEYWADLSRWLIQRASLDSMYIERATRVDSILSRRLGFEL